MPEVPPLSEDELHQWLSRRFSAGVFFLGVTQRFFVCGGGAGESESEALVGEGDGGGEAVFLAGPFPLPFPLPLAGVLRGSGSSSSSDSSRVMTVFLRGNDSFFLVGGGVISKSGSSCNSVRLRRLDTAATSFIYWPGGSFLHLVGGGGESTMITSDLTPYLAWRDESSDCIMIFFSCMDAINIRRSDCSSDWDTFRCTTSFILLILSSRL